MDLLLLFTPLIITILLSIKFIIYPYKKSITIKLLGVFFMFFSIALFAILFQYTRTINTSLNNYFFILELMFYPVMLSLPSLVFFYIISLTDYVSNYNSIWKILPHFYIPIQSLLFNSYPYINSSNKNLEIIQHLDYTNFFSLKVIFIILNVIYLIKSLSIYKKHRLKVAQVLSYDKGIRMNWIYLFIMGYLLFILCFFILSPNSSPYVVYIPLLLLITYLFYQRNNQNILSLENTSKENETIFKSSNTEFNLLSEKLIQYMTNEKPFLKKDLTLYELAKMLKTNSSYLSTTINSVFNNSFVSFINNYRINYAKKLLTNSNYKEYTIEAISEEVGFNSKSAFNRAFKKNTSITPSEYRKRNN